jgi:hypothetical protein
MKKNKFHLSLDALILMWIGRQRSYNKDAMLLSLIAQKQFINLDNEWL